VYALKDEVVGAERRGELRYTRPDGDVVDGAKRRAN